MKNNQIDVRAKFNIEQGTIGVQEPDTGYEQNGRK